MSSALSVQFAMLDQLFHSCQQDYDLLACATLDANWLSSYDHQRIVNSFLFNYIKIQDKLGAKLFRTLLYELREVSDDSMPMIDVLNLLEKLRIVDDAQSWDRLREIRNAIAHDYPMSVQERLEMIGLAIQGYDLLRQTYQRIRDYVTIHLPG